MTLVGCLSVTVALLYMLWQSCKYDYVECSYPVLPMISDVICLPFYDRVFCIFSTFFMLTAYQADCRAFYKKLYGIASPGQNDLLMLLGLVASIALPSIGFFDEHTYGTVHGICAVLFFGSVGIYAFIIGGIMGSNKDKFPEEEWKDIDWMNKLKWIMFASLLILGLSEALWGSNYWLTPFTEWLTTILYLNYFAILNMTNTFYDSVHNENVDLSKRNPSRLRNRITTSANL